MTDCILPCRATYEHVFNPYSLDASNEKDWLLDYDCTKADKENDDIDWLQSLDD